jgi:hypothetical protein
MRIVPNEAGRDLWGYEGRIIQQSGWNQNLEGEMVDN